jgi:prenyltransferase beta subunit
MTQEWSMRLRVDPLPVLLSCGCPAVEYFARRDLLSGTVESIDSIWRLPEVQKLLRKQQSNGAWKHSEKETVTYPPYHYELVETWKHLRILVENYEADRRLGAVQQAAEFMFSCQTGQGDIRGMLANQYATYYTGAILTVLIKAGYSDDMRVTHGLDWLLSMRQNDGGWTIPILTHEYTLAAINKLTSTYAEPVEPDRAKPSSHNWTDMALRAFAAHPTRRYTQEVYEAADLLKSYFFQPDVYTSYQDERYWVRFMFWWPNLVTALDLLSLLGYSKDDAGVQKGLNWIIDNQLPSGLWKLDYGKNAKQKQVICTEQYWLALKIARILKRFSEK